jgi:hypothetical protein
MLAQADRDLRVLKGLLEADGSGAAEPEPA